MALSVAERCKRHRERYPEKFTAEARREGRKSLDAAYRKTEAYQRARNRYIRSGKKHLADHDRHLKNRYGKTLEDKIKQYDKQGGICSLCGMPLPSNIIKCHWDHDHKSGKMRDLLHKYCNQMLGWIENDLYEKALAYLEKHETSG